MNLVKFKYALSELLIQKNPTYIGLIVRSCISIGIITLTISYGKIDGKSYIPHFIVLIIPIIIFLPLLFMYAFQAVIKIWAIDSASALHEKIIASIILIILVLGFIYLELTCPPKIPVYLQ